MTDKQIIIDGVDVSECISLDKYYIANCTEEFIDCALGGLYEYQDEYKRTCKENPNCYYKQLARKEQECEALQMSKNEAVEIIAELKAYKDVNEDFKTAWEELKAENDELKKIINEAKSSSLDLQSFLVGEAIQNEYEQQLDQLKTKNEELKKELEAVYDDCKGCPTCNEALYNANLYAKEYKKLKQILAEIKEIAKNAYDEFGNDVYGINPKQILQKISKCEVENDNK